MLGYILRVVMWPLGYYNCNCCQEWQRRYRGLEFSNRGGYICGCCCFS